MFTYDKSFDRKVFLGHCDSILKFSHFFQIMGLYDQTFDPNILIGHCDIFHGLVILLYILALNWFINILLSHYVCV